MNGGNKHMKKYESIDMEIISVSMEDVIASSTPLKFDGIESEEP